MWYLSQQEGEADVWFPVAVGVWGNQGKAGPRWSLPLEWLALSVPTQAFESQQGLQPLEWLALSVPTQVYSVGACWWGHREWMWDPQSHSMRGLQKMMELWW